MANKLEVNFLGDSKVVIEDDISGLGPRHITSNGFIEAREQGGRPIYINREQITFVRDWGAVETQPAPGGPSSYMGRR